MHFPGDSTCYITREMEELTSFSGANQEGQNLSTIRYSDLNGQGGREEKRKEEKMWNQLDISKKFQSITQTDTQNNHFYWL